MPRHISPPPQRHLTCCTHKSEGGVLRCSAVSHSKNWHNCSQCETIPLPLFLSSPPHTLTLLRMKNTIAPLYSPAFIVDCFYVSEISFPPEPVLIHPRTHSPVSASPGYLKHEHGFHNGFWHDPKCDRNTVIHIFLIDASTILSEELGYSFHETLLGHY